MANQTTPLSQQLFEESEKPLTAKDRFVGIAIACVFIALCIAMWLKPDILGVDSSDFSGRGGRTIATIVDFGWSPGVGAILGLIAIIMIYGSLTKRGAARQQS